MCSSYIGLTLLQTKNVASLEKFDFVTVMKCCSSEKVTHENPRFVGNSEPAELCVGV